MIFTEQDMDFAQVEGITLQGVLYRPSVPAGTDLPVLIDIHGGAWSSLHRKAGRHYCRALASRGLCVFAIDFRQGPDFKHPAASSDIAAAVRFIRTTDALQLKPSSVSLIGSSSGGHLALLVALNPDIQDHHQTPINTGSGFQLAPTISARVDRVIGLWPVSNPIARYQYVLARLHEDPESWINFAPNRLAEGHRAYFGDTRTMQAASIQQLLATEAFSELPPLLIVQPALDQNVPIFMSQTLLGGYEAAGGIARYREYAGVEHGFAHAEGPQTDTCINDILAFIRST